MNLGEIPINDSEEFVVGKKSAVLAIDMGGSKFIVGFVDKTGKVLSSHREVWLDIRNENAVKNQLLSAVADTLKNNSEYDVLAAGITAPGFADEEKGFLVSMSLGNIYMWDIAGDFRKFFGLRVFIRNDAKACALAEMWFGSCRDCDNFMYITVSTGIGGAFILDGKLYDGAFGRAGEVGNSFLIKNGRANGKGRPGTLEMYASTCGMAMNFIELGGNTPLEGTILDGKYIADLAKTGDPIAIKTYELEGVYLGTLIAQACNLLDLERVVIGGGISLSYSLYRESLEKTVFEQKYWRDGNFSIVATVLGYEGALVGAAAVAYLGIREPLSRTGGTKHKERQKEK